MKMKFIKSCLVAATVLLTGSVFAQNNIPRVTPFSGVNDYRTWSIGAWGGASSALVPFGAPYDFGKINFKNTGLLYGVYVKKQIFHGFGLQADFMRGNVKGSRKSNEPSYNVSGFDVEGFNTNINWAGSVSGVFTLGTVNWLNRQASVLPYVSVGGGYMSFNPKVSGDMLNYDYYVDENATLSNSKPAASKAFYVPVGVGARFNVATGVNIDLGYHLYFVNDKKFDGVYGNGRDDKFSSLNIGIEFALGNKQKPQLAVVNPAAQLAMDLWDRNEALKEQLKTASEKNEEELQTVRQQITDLKKDSDGDGVPDVHDKCPGTESGMRVDGAGCPLPQPKQIIKQEKVVVTQEDRKVVDEAIKNLEFDLGKATIRPASFESLDRVAELLVNKNFSLKLAGHTDNTGSESLNMRLSKERAEAVKSYLVSKGANPSRIEAVGYGDAQPIATNETAEGRQQNRRVEFTLY